MKVMYVVFFLSIWTTYWKNHKYTQVTNFKNPQRLSLYCLGRPPDPDSKDIAVSGNLEAEVMAEAMAEAEAEADSAYG